MLNNNTGHVDTPVISIIIPAYNCSRFIGETLRSVFRQSLLDFEVIVVNDGSPDTPALEAAIAEYRERITYIRQPNAGPSAARNRGLRVAKADLVAFLDSDDSWECDYLTTQIAQLKSRNLDLVFCDATLYGSSESRRRTFMQAYPSDEIVTAKTLAAGQVNIITTCTVIRRDLISKTGGFDEGFLRSEDYDLWMRIALAGGRLGYHKSVLAHHRVHESSQSSHLVTLVRDQIRVLTKIRCLEPALMSTINKNIESLQVTIDVEEAKESLLKGEYSVAYEHLKAAQLHSQGWKLKLAMSLMRVSPTLLRLLLNLRGS